MVISLSHNEAYHLWTNRIEAVYLATMLYICRETDHSHTLWETTMDRKHQGSDGVFPGLSLLIRSIQRIEGNPDCFDTAGEYCDRYDCQWRCYCLIKSENSHNTENREDRKEKYHVSDNDSDRNTDRRTLGFLSPSHYTIW
jgi:hypothetical protein